MTTITITTITITMTITITITYNYDYYDYNNDLFINNYITDCNSNIILYNHMPYAINCHSLQCHYSNYFTMVSNFQSKTKKQK